MVKKIILSITIICLLSFMVYAVDVNMPWHPWDQISRSVTDTTSMNDIIQVNDAPRYNIGLGRDPLGDYKLGVRNSQWYEDASPPDWTFLRGIYSETQISDPKRIDGGGNPLKEHINPARFHVLAYDDSIGPGDHVDKAIGVDIVHGIHRDAAGGVLETSIGLAVGGHMNTGQINEYYEILIRNIDLVDLEDLGGTLIARDGTVDPNTFYALKSASQLQSHFEGRVGIGPGASIPTQALHVDGNVEVTGTITCGGAPCGGGSGFWSSSANGIHPTDLTDNVGIGKNDPNEALDVTGNILTNGKLIFGTGIEPLSGDSRGTGSVDFQITRDVSNKVSEGDYSVVGGGENNRVDSVASYSTVSGGLNNWILGSTQATIAGGVNNRISASISSTVAGGAANQIGAGTTSFIGGGTSNRIHGGFSHTIAAGDGNEISGIQGSTISGGLGNTIDNAQQSTIVGGYQNVIEAGADSSVAMGSRAVAEHDHTFVWSGSRVPQYRSNGPETFNVDAPGGVFIQTDPGEDVQIDGADLVVTGGSICAGADCLGPGLREVWGIVDGAGNILASSGGFTVTRIVQGVYEIDLTPDFAGRPFIQVTVEAISGTDRPHAHTSNIGTDTFQITTMNFGSRRDRTFHFTAMSTT